MRILLDLSPEAIAKKAAQFEFEPWQLRTPLTRYKLSGLPYGLDNGCFSRFEQKTWMRLLGEARLDKPLFVCLPDIVGDARRTLELFSHFHDLTRGLPRALVLQDGIGGFNIPWNDIAAVFVGGSDVFKKSHEAFAAAKTAKYLGKWVHVGRVNTADRVGDWIGLADSIDGSGICKYDHMLKDVLREIRNEDTQIRIAI